MAELGNDSDAMHREVGKMAAQSNLNVLICYGPLSAGMAEEAKQANRLKVFHTKDISELNKLVKENVGPNDAVLFKASHATNLIAAVRANYPLVYFKTFTLDQLRRQIVRASILK
jgi:UDP-N-acetylmuramoyl-tripeptide--D-alanyl-D-alanine ligase